MEKQPQQAEAPAQQIRMEYVDRPDVSETFADSATAVVFDGQTLRIELCATRIDPTQPPTAPRARRYPVCRIALPPSAAIDLFNRLQQTMAALVQQGVLKQTPPAGQLSQADGAATGRS